MCKKCGNIFSCRITYSHLIECPNCKEKIKSRIEIDIVDFINNIQPQSIQRNNRKILDGLELDIFLVNKNIAIEYNSNYYHSELAGNKDSKYHLNKTELCESKGIRLLHIFENEWKNKQDIVKSVLSSTMGIYENIIYARNCKIQIVPNAEKNLFLDKNHLQGKDRSKIKIGLYHENSLISLMTFCKPRYNKNYQWEMSRFCNKINTTVVGGAGKLFSYFLKNYTPKSILTYSDRRYFTEKYMNHWDLNLMKIHNLITHIL